MSAPLVTWARGLHADASVVLGSLALRLAAYQRDGAGVGAPIGPCDVRDEDTGARATFHPSTGVHGLLDLPPGTRAVLAVDPAGRWLPRRLSPTAPDRSALRAALAIGAPLPADPGAAWLDVPMFPTIALPIPPAETVLWGVVQRSGAPVPFAFVRVVIDTIAFRGATDASGTYQIWLRGLRPSEDPPTAHPITAAAPHAPPGGDGADALPPSFAELMPATPAFSALYGPPTTVSAILPVGTRTRVDLTVS